jgi:phosphatidylserine decarboxylase
MMKGNVARWRDRVLHQEDLNFLLTNRVPRIALTRFMGWFARIESPLLARLSIAVWRVFTDLDLSEAEPQRYRSLKECFTRKLRPGLRPVDLRPDVLTSPCDAIVGACGTVEDGMLLQAKGMAYRMTDLFGAHTHCSPYDGGQYVTLRLTSSMYHRFHAPAEGVIEHVSYIGGDTWNVNPIALKRVQALFTRNERAVIRLRLSDGTPMALVPVAAILVASIRLHFLDVLLHVRWPGPTELPCSQSVKKGEELGWFEHGSTIIVFVPKGYQLTEGVVSGTRIRTGQALLRREQNPQRMRPLVRSMGEFQRHL